MSLDAMVERAAALLDEKAPGWAAKVDPGKLKMMDPFSCVLGQVFGGYCRGLGAIGLAQPDEGHDPEIDPAFTRSTAREFWVAAIEKRRGA